MIYSLSFLLLFAVSITAKSISNGIEMTERPDRPDDEYCDDRDIRFRDKTDMAENLRSDLIRAICDRERHDRRPDFNYEEICTFIRLKFESSHGAYWSCAVDPRYIKAWHTPNTYAHFTYRGIDFHFFQD